jgi:hypothetical protein
VRTLSTSPSRQASALAVLVGTRPVLEHGWLQNAERVVRTPDGRLRPRGHGVVVSACLVGAVVEAGRRYADDPAAAGPALDALWLALYDDRGADAVGRVPSPVVRDLRARDLARWNDAPDRTAEQVLALVDRATWRVWAQQRAAAGTQAAATDRLSDPAGRPEAADAGAPESPRGRGAAAVPAGRPR